jgi:hypothetical protein
MHAHARTHARNSHQLDISDNELPDTDADMLANAVKKTLNLHTLNVAKYGV